MDLQKEIDNLKVKAGYDGKPQQWQFGFDLACRELAKAQAVPDGYKVVPVNYECVWCGCTELDGWTDETMIEAQEPAND